MSMQKILTAATVSILSAIIIISAIAFGTGNAKPGYGLTKKKNISELAEEFENKNNFENKYTLLSLGQIRTRTKPEKKDQRSSTVIVKALLEYEKDNTILIEEMTAKNQAIKTTFLSYFSRFTQRELLLAGEDKVKEQILEQINSLLVLGKINSIYFEEYIFLN